MVGYAYSTTFRPRPAYAATRETSIYLAPDATGRGPDRLTYSHLLTLLRSDGMHCAVAVVAEPNPASIALHESLGFKVVGTLNEVGRKFGRWVNTRWQWSFLVRSAESGVHVGTGLDERVHGGCPFGKWPGQSVATCRNVRDIPSGASSPSLVVARSSCSARSRRSVGTAPECMASTAATAKGSSVLMVAMMSPRDESQGDQYVWT